jgi:hypothetical protein
MQAFTSKSYQHADVEKFFKKKLSTLRLVTPLFPMAYGFLL